MDVTPAVGRTRRRALREISNGMIALEVTQQLNGLSPEFLGLPSPSPSPDEMVIRDRGTRKQSDNWSPTTFSQYSGGTPISHNITPTKQAPTRSSPRKRIHLFNNNTPANTGHIDNKRRKALSTVRKQKASLEATLRALSHEQLQDIINGILTDNPQIKQQVDTNIPEPDLKPLSDRLNVLKKNIYRSCPGSSRLTSNTDSPAYNRASVHLQMFKQVLTEQGKLLSSSEQWGSVLEYSIMAWSYVRETPVWDNPPHNRVRDACFKFLSGQIMHALKNINYNEEVYNWLKQELEHCQADSKDIVPVIKYMEKET